MSKVKALAIVKEVQQIAEKYQNNFDVVENAQNYSAEYVAKKRKENNDYLKKQLDDKSVIAKHHISELKKEIDAKVNEIYFPLLSKAYNENANLRAEQQISNAMSMFQINYLNGNPDFVIDQLKSVIGDTQRRDYVSTLLNQIVNFPHKDPQMQTAYDQAVKIKSEFDKANGIPDLESSKRILRYAEKVNEVTSELVKKDFGGFAIPDYQDKFEFQDQMEMSRLSQAADVDMSEFTTSPGNGITGLSDGE